MSSLQSPEERPCVEVTPGEARYLLTIFDIARAGMRISQASLARRLGVSGPTALEMVRRLRQLGLIGEDGLELTSAGTSAALGLGSRRHAAHVLALEVLGLDEPDAETEARRLAPAVSATLAKYLMRWRDSNQTAD
jgi:Mn-dependent DtxR family transcriptional regulator